MNVRQLAALANLGPKTMASLDFMDDAACAGESTGDFFPEPNPDMKPVYKICGRCPVTAACCTYAIDGHIYFGTFGGLSERQRKQLREHGQRPGSCTECGRPTPLNRTTCNNCL